MNKLRIIPISAVILIALLLSACSGTIPAISEKAAASLNEQVQKLLPAEPATQSQPEAQKSAETAPAAPIEPGLLAAYESTLSDIYTRVNPSVVNIRVLVPQNAVLSGSDQFPNFPFFNMPGFPGMPEAPQNPDQQNPEIPQYSQALGSGFVWDKTGYIVTNNHVVDGADKIEVTFQDGTIVPAERVGADPDSDLAVIKVDVPEAQLQPVEMGTSDGLKVGQLAIAIGNPYGLEGTMTVGIISALGRSLPAGELNFINGPVYRIPDVIQTDAPINPGNSGGVLVNDQGKVIGVTFAIESTTGANAGIGFVIPASIVEKVVPVLIDKGSYAHPYLGISGTSLTPDLAKAMNLEESQRGALVAEVVAGSPADKAGLRGSDRQVTIDGQQVSVGGDVILAIDDQPVKEMDDLIAYLSAQTEVGQKVSLTVLRDSKETKLEATLGARPSQEQTQAQPEVTSGKAYLGILGLALTPEIAREMDLPEDQQGVLVERVEAQSPADEANLRGSDKQITINGTDILVGGDVITALDKKEVATVEELSALIQEAGIGTQVTLTIIRDGKTLEVPVTLAERPQ